MTPASAARKAPDKPDKPDQAPPSDGREAMTVARARDTLAELVLRAGFGRAVFVIERRGQPTAVLIGFEEYERLHALDGAAK